MNQLSRSTLPITHGKLDRCWDSSAMHQLSQSTLSMNPVKKIGHRDTIYVKVNIVQPQSTPSPVDPPSIGRAPGQRLGRVIWSSRSHRRRHYIIAAAKPRRHPIRKYKARQSYETVKLLALSCRKMGIALCRIRLSGFQLELTLVNTTSRRTPQTTALRHTNPQTSRFRHKYLLLRWRDCF
jgi:hypothetical protein